MGEMTAIETRPRRAAIAWLRRLRVLALAAAIPVAGLFGLALGEHRLAAPPALPVLRTAPRYTLTNQFGRPVSSDSFRSKVQIVSFLFPYCTTMCPLIAAHLANFENLGARPAGIADKVAIVSFNLDPAGTGPAQMRAFLKQYGWNPGDRNWQYLTGSPAAIRRVVRNGFGVAYQRVSLSSEARGGGVLPVVQLEVINKIAEEAHPNYDIVHDDVIEIVDQKGRIRKIFENADTVGWARLLNVVQNLLGEGSEARR
jgi:protein SCO1/2